MSVGRGVIVSLEQDRVYNGDTSNPSDQHHDHLLDYLINVIHQRNNASSAHHINLYFQRRDSDSEEELGTQ